MSFGTLFFIALVLGAIIGVVALLWDNADGKVHWFGDIVHSKVVTVGLGVFALITLGWAFGLYGGDIVLTALIALITWAVAAYITSVVLPGV